MKPLHTACTSKAAPRSMPRPAWMRVAVAGKVSSGVEVAQTIRSRSSGARPALSSAACAARRPMCEVNSSSAAIRRSRIPVRFWIHASEVSIRPASSSLVTIREGR